MTVVFSNQGTEGEPVTYKDGSIASGVRIIAYHTGGEFASDGDTFVTVTDSNGEYAFTDNHLPPTYGSGNTAKTDYVHLFAEIGSGGTPRQATPIRPWQGYQLEPVLPPSIVGIWKGDEGSGTTLGDSEGTNDMTINGPAWQSVSRFRGGYGLNFGNGDSISGDLLQPSSFTWVIRVAAGSLGTSSPTYRTLIAHDSDPSLVYQVADDYWAVQISGNNSTRVSDPQIDVESEDRIVAARYEASSSTAYLDVWDGDKNKIGVNSHSGVSLSYDSTTTYLGEWGDGSREWTGLMDPNWHQFDESLSDSELNGVVQDQF